MQHAHECHAAPTFTATPALVLHTAPTGDRRCANGQQGHDASQCEHSRGDQLDVFAVGEQTRQQRTGGQHEPFSRRKNLEPPGEKWLVQGLELRATKEPAVYPRPENKWQALLPKVRVDTVVNTALPYRVSKEIETPRITPLQVRFRHAITLLLPKITFDRCTAVMPHNRARMVDDFFVSHEQSPAEIDVIAGGAMLRVKQTNDIERLFAVRHIATGNVFGVLVVHQHTSRVAGSLVHTLRNETILRRGKIRSSHG